MRKMKVAVIGLLLASAATAQNLDDFEKVLLPIVTTKEVSGANQAAFVSTLAVHATEPIRFFPAYEAPGDLTPVIGTFTSSPETASRPFAFTPPSRLGRILFLERNRADDFWIHATLLSRRVTDLRWNETRLPVVREARFRTSPIRIPGIESRYSLEGGPACRTAVPQYRHHLRVYDVDGRGDGLVLVRLYNERAGRRLIAEIQLALTAREGTDASYPAFGELLINEVCNPFSCHTPCTGGSQMVEIIPLTPGMRYWAMVTATDNVTQQVTLAHPD